MQRKIPRDRYLKKLVDHRGNGLVKVITGVRRCGKSYLLNRIFREHLLSEGFPESGIIQFAFDSAIDLERIGENVADFDEWKRKVDPRKFMDYVRGRMKGGGPRVLLLDEIQLLGAFETVLNGFLQSEGVEVYVTGSNAKFLSKDILTEFAGRGDEIRMAPLDFSEFIGAFPGDRYERLSQYMLYGGIPLVALQDRPEDKAAMLSNLFGEIYISDIVRRNGIRNRGELEDLLNVLSSSIGSVTNPEKLKRTFQSVKGSKVTANTIKKYIDCLEDAFLIESAERYDIKGKRYISSAKKYYFCDLGLRNARLNFRQFEPTHALENVVFNELRHRGYAVDVGIVPVVEKAAGNVSVRKSLEVDFVCNLGTQRCYIQSAYSMPTTEKRAAELRPFLRIGDSFKKILVTNDMTPRHYDENGILVMNVFDFLLDENSIE